MNLSTASIVSFRHVIVLALLIALIGSVSTANSAPLLLNTFQQPVSGEADVYGAMLVDTTGPTAFSTSLYTGSLTSSVYTADPTNPYGPAGLTFTYLLQNDATSTDALGRLTVVDFATYLVDASYQTPVPFGDTIPFAVDRSASGGTVGFTFLPTGLEPGTTSALLVLQTDSTGYVPSVASVLNGDIAQVATFAPVPEPGAIVAVAGLVSLGLVMRRRSKLV